MAARGLHTPLGLCCHGVHWRASTKEGPTLPCRPYDHHFLPSCLLPAVILSNVPLAQCLFSSPLSRLSSARAARPPAHLNFMPAMAAISSQAQRCGPARRSMARYSNTSAAAPSPHPARSPRAVAAVAAAWPGCPHTVASPGLLTLGARRARTLSLPQGLLTRGPRMQCHPAPCPGTLPSSASTPHHTTPARVGCWSARCRPCPPGPAVRPASVRVMLTSNSQATLDWSETPAHSSVAQPRALSADSSEPRPSWPTRWDRYSSAFLLQGRQAGAAGSEARPASGAAGAQLGSAPARQLLLLPVAAAASVWVVGCNVVRMACWNCSLLLQLLQAEQC